MRCYLVTGGGRKRFAGTAADSKEVRDTIVEETGLKKKDVEIEQVEVPTSKTELLEFINELCEELDEKTD